MKDLQRMAGKLPHHPEQCSNARAETVKLLVSLGAIINVKDDCCFTPLKLAIEENDTVLIKALVDAGADLNACSCGRLLLNLAALRAEAKTVEVLLDLGADFCATDSYGRSPLHAAAAAGNVDLISLLYKRGADINATDSRGMSPIHLAAWHGHHHAVAWFLENGLSKDLKDNAGWTPLHFAAEWGRVEVAEVLLARSAEINPVDSSGRTPLDWASFSSHTDMVKLLTSWGGTDEEYQARVRQTEFLCENLLTL